MKRAVIVLGTVVMAFSASACSSAAEQFNDAPIDRKDNSPAVIHSMPDGFANFASKCDGYGHRVFTTRGGNKAGKAVAVIADPKCLTQKGNR